MAIPDPMSAHAFTATQSGSASSGSQSPATGGAGEAGANAAWLARREAAVPRGVATGSTAFIDRAQNAEMWDAEGRRYIDFGSGIAVTNTGHRHPKIMAAAAAQAERFAHVAFQVIAYDVYVELAERLNALAPIEHAKSIFFTTGAEATENAVKNRPCPHRAAGRHHVHRGVSWPHPAHHGDGPARPCRTARRAHRSCPASSTCRSRLPTMAPAKPTACVPCAICSRPMSHPRRSRRS